MAIVISITNFTGFSILEKILNFFGIYRYAKVLHVDGNYFVCEVKEVLAMSEEDLRECWIEDIWMTKREFQEIEEFTGF